ncbi:MAG: hypothetical protein GTO46_12245 [Gemmatimonadetes bacterium]|nr:hypothetical protein [Gemmatimonadota bacterium]NIO32362.1 hypothetical protein [Gemmatimonadota bacterium]
MTISTYAWRIAALALVVGHLGCAPSERAAEPPDEAARAAEAEPPPESPAVSEERAAEAEPEAAAPGVDAPDVAPERPGAVAPAAEVDPRVTRNWVLLEFSRPVEEADLEWLEANGFHVDSVMSELRVRGWLERSEGGRAIAGDPRIARVHTQMR